jgi:hypothetical protein
MVAADGDEIHPLVEEGLERTEDEFMPVIMGGLVCRLGTSCKRYLCTVVCTGCLVKAARGRRPSLLSVLVGPGLFFGVGLVVELGVRFLTSTLLQWRATVAQRSALLTDVEDDFRSVVPEELEREVRIVNARVFVYKASFGVTPIWLRRLTHRGWTWSADLTHWQSVQRHRTIGGMMDGLLPAPSNRWLLRRLHLRDVRDRVRPPRVAHAPPPLSLPDGLEQDAPGDFLCPIAHTVMTDPVVGPAGISYERAALQQWLRRRKVDPSTQGPLEIQDVYSNLNLRSAIAAWAERTQADGAVDGDGAKGGTSEEKASRTDPARQDGRRGGMTRPREEARRRVRVLHTHSTLPLRRARPQRADLEGWLDMD